MAPPASRPLITANMVTFARLVPMPLVCWFFYQGELWTALVLGTLIGCTDFVDGYLARKHGPTVLGGLMDPIADKVFIAFAYLPFADFGLFPTWAVALMFVREFLVTALRSTYEQRDLRMKTSYLGKVKTWTQMQGVGMLVLFLLLAEHRAVLSGLILTAMIAPLVAFAGLWWVKRRLWKGALVMSALCAPLLYFHVQQDMAATADFIMYVVVAITWLSGIDYVMVGMRDLRGTGDFARADAVRLLGAIALPCLLFAALVTTPVSPWLIVAILAIELAVGGLDNLLCHHRVGASATAWGLRVLGASLLLGGAILAAHQGRELVADWLVAAALVVSAVGVIREFWRGSDCYLDSRLRDKPIAERRSRTGSNLSQASS